MVTWTEITIKVIENEKAILDELDRMYGPRFINVSKQGEKTTIRLTFEDYDEVDDELRLWNVLLNASRQGAKALLHTFTADDGGRTKITYIGFEHFEGLLDVDRLIRDTDLALLYAKVESGEESPTTLGEAFAGMVIDPQEPEEVEEAYAVFELLMKHSVVPTDESREQWLEILESLRAAGEIEVELDEEFELDDWKVKTLSWLEKACREQPEGFDFLPQASSIRTLLDVCIKVLPSVPEQDKALLVAAMREFEECGTSILWSPMDIDQDEEFGLTDAEKREAISRFISKQGCSDYDWMDIDKHTREVVAERSPKVVEKKTKKTKKSKSKKAAH
ncbi:hypothetical protein [Serratia nevei]|uniref:hypothetical protein n=1 Tax=Serratia nevei TaxID=2703794 RepID=UPI00254C2CF1|nr:hypothetical protein [Serratia nevei]MDK5165564.1 hypothetical protein [Serratia nevei]